MDAAILGAIVELVTGRKQRGGNPQANGPIAVQLAGRGIASSSPGEAGNGVASASQTPE
jgi:hypothetical protein